MKTGDAPFCGQKRTVRSCPDLPTSERPLTFLSRRQLLPARRTTPIHWSTASLFVSILLRQLRKVAFRKNHTVVFSPRRFPTRLATPSHLRFTRCLGRSIRRHGTAHDDGC